MNFFFFHFRSKKWVRFGPGPCEWGGINTEVEILLHKYRSKFAKYVLGWKGEGNGTYYEDWTDYLSDEPMEGPYDSDGDQARYAEFMEEMETAARIQRAALLSTEHACFMAWLAEKGKEELYEQFEKVFHAERAHGEYPGVPVRDLSKD